MKVTSETRTIPIRLLFAGCALALALTACQKSKDGEGENQNGNIATAPQATPSPYYSPSANCVSNPGSFQQRGWSPYQGYGFSGYGYGGYGHYGYGYWNASVTVTIGSSAEINDQIGWPSQGHYGYGYGYGSGFGHPHAQQNPGQIYNNGFCGCPAGTLPVCDANLGMGCANPSQFQGWNQNNYAYWQWNHSGRQFSYGGYGTPQYQNGCYNAVLQSCRLGSNDCGYGTCRPTIANSPMGICAQ